MKNGFSLVETILVIFIAGILVLVLVNIPNALGLINKSKHLSLAKEIATKQLEDKRNTNYANLVNDTITLSTSSEPRLSLLPAGMVVVKVEDCSENICQNSEAIKQVGVSVSWLEGSKTQNISLDTLVGEGGLNQ